MLGADLIGFHTQYSLQQLPGDRRPGARVPHRLGALRRQKRGHTTLVKPFPISIAFPGAFLDVFAGGRQPGKEALLKELGVSGSYLGVGVERMDYTKGILERFRAIERFLEKHPALSGSFVFVELGAPSRIQIKGYQDLLAESRQRGRPDQLAFKSRDWKPIIFLKKHHSHEEIQPFYKSADLCLVTSLHDGMNLVAKEFVGGERRRRRRPDPQPLHRRRPRTAGRPDRQPLRHRADGRGDSPGPGDVRRKSRAVRMQRMRETVRVHNIYRWAGTLIEELVNIQVGGRPAAQK